MARVACAVVCGLSVCSVSVHLSRCVQSARLQSAVNVNAIPKMGSNTTERISPGTLPSAPTRATCAMCLCCPGDRFERLGEHIDNIIAERFSSSAATPPLPLPMEEKEEMQQKS
jgi:hypothetical protein